MENGNHFVYPINSLSPGGWSFDSKSVIFKWAVMITFLSICSAIAFW